MLRGVCLRPEKIVFTLREIELKIGQIKDVLTTFREAEAAYISYRRGRRGMGA
jgi:hypothetical protein